MRRLGSANREICCEVEYNLRRCPSDERDSSVGAAAPAWRLAIVPTGQFRLGAGPGH